MAEFGSVVDAVECALSLQRGMAERNASVAESKRIEVRIGINLGEVIVEGADCYGDGVNVAARLQQLADPGGICISGKVSKEVEKKLAFGFESMGEQRMKNIAEPIACYRVSLQISPAAQPDQTLPIPPRSSARVAIAVLPFTNMSSDPEQEYFVDGLAEDLITDLSKVPGLFVISRHSAFSYKGKPIDIRAVAKDLGVRYVVEGSVRRAAARIRINAQLIDANDGTHLWADRFEELGANPTVSKGKGPAAVHRWSSESRSATVMMTTLGRWPRISASGPSRRFEQPDILVGTNH